MDKNLYTFGKPKKSLGQNFLMHARIAERIVLAAELPKDAVVLEVGPGRGMLTKILLAHAKKVIAVETDHELAATLREMFWNEISEGKLELHEGDMRAVALETFPRGYHVVANIPYYITGELIRQFLESKNQPSSMTLLVQKEVAERVARSQKESLLSLSIKAYGTPRYAFTVPRGAFVPAPNVDSAVLTIKGISRENFASSEEEKRFFTLIHAGFAHKRKFLKNNLKEIGEEALALPDKIRAEDLSLSDWVALAKKQPL